MVPFPSSLKRRLASLATVIPTGRPQTFPSGVTELHHSTPKYLGGAANGPRVPLDAAYHQQITNAFRDAWKYGQAQPPAAQVQQIMRDVYSKYPLPPGY